MERGSARSCTSATSASTKRVLRKVIADCYSFYSRAERLTAEVREQMEQRFGMLPDEELLRFYASEQTAKMADRIKSLGFKHSTLGGMTFSAADVEIPEKKKEIMEEADEKVRNILRNIPAWSDHRGRALPRDRRGLGQGHRGDQTSG